MHGSLGVVLIDERMLGCMSEGVEREVALWPVAASTAELAAIATFCYQALGILRCLPCDLELLHAPEEALRVRVGEYRTGSKHKVMRRSIVLGSCSSWAPNTFIAIPR
jgi:hypothetical protein